MELSDGQKYAIVFLGSLAVAGIVLGTLVFPFWNFIREDVTEEVEIFQSADGNCYVDTIDGIPKTIENCNLDGWDYGNHNVWSWTSLGKNCDSW